MKKNHTKVIIIVSLSILLIVSLSPHFNSSKNYQKIDLKINPNSIISNKVETKIEAKVNSQANYLVENKSKNIEVSLMVLDKTYSIEVPENSSVFDAMKKIEEESTKDNSFSFKYNEHLGLGAFINSIDGIDGEPGKYWIYYINNNKDILKYIIANIYFSLVLH